MARIRKRYLETTMETESRATSVSRYSVGIYSRLSVDQEERKTESIENQIEIIRQYIIRENDNLQKKQYFEIYDTYIDRGISGTSFERAGFDRLMEDVRSQNVNCIMVKDLSRFGRDYLETGSYIEKILPFLGVRFIAVTDGFDSLSENVSERKLAMNIKNLVNDMYAKDISKKVMAARKLAAENGAYIGSRPPYGYVTEERNGIRRLIIHPENAKIVHYIFESYEAGISYGEIVSWLYQKKVHKISDYHKYGHTFWEKGEILHQWNPGMLRQILSNPVYIGKLVQGKKKSRLQERQKGSCNTREEEWIVVENSHEAIVDQELFEKVNFLLVGRKNLSFDKEKTKERAVRGDEHIFRHVLYCGNCGAKMHATYYQSRINEKRSYAYHCRRAYYIDGRKCTKNYIKEDELKNFCLEEIRRILKEQKLSSKALTKMNRLECEKMKTAYLEEQNKIIQERERFVVQAGTLYRQYKEGSISEEEYCAFRANRAEYEKFCEIRLEELKRKIRKSEIRSEEENKFLRSLQKAKGVKQLNVQLVESLIERITVSADGRIEISFCFCDQNGGEGNA